MHSRTRKWLVWVVLSISSVVIVSEVVLRRSVAAEPQGLHNTRPLDNFAERLERPRPEQDSVRPGAFQAQLMRNEVMRLAHAEAKRNLTAGYGEYDLREVTFDQWSRWWAVTFTRTMTSSASGSCLTVLVHDGSRETTSHPCP